MSWTWTHLGTHPNPKELLLQLQQTPPPLVAVDTETISLEDRVSIGIGIAVSPTDAFYFRMFPETCQEMPWWILEDPTIIKVMHNALFDLSALREYKLNITNIRDTSVMAHLLGHPPKLATLASVLLMMEITDIKELLYKKGMTMLDLEPEVVARKCCMDAQATIAVYLNMLPQINEEYFELECQIIPLLELMSRRGIVIDQEVRAGLELALQAQVEYYLGLAEAQGFNPASPQQVAYTLAKRGVFLPFTKSKKSLRTDEATLERVDDPLAALVLNYRGAAKSLGTYIKPLAGKERAFTHFHLDAITGRVSSTKRNLQNMDRGLRCMFVPDSGLFTEIDYSQIELRILAYLSQDKEMNYIFKSGGDIHIQTAIFMNISRKIAKSVNFAMIYGATVPTIMETAKVWDRYKAEELLYDWFKQYREAGGWIQMQQEQGLRDGYIHTLFGRKINLPSTLAENEMAIKRKAVNYVIQGSAAEIIKRAMLKCGQLPMVLQVHDSLLFDGRVDLPESLDSVSPLRTPLEVKETERWE